MATQGMSVSWFAPTLMLPVTSLSGGELLGKAGQSLECEGRQLPMKRKPPSGPGGPLGES